MQINPSKASISRQRQLTFMACVMAVVADAASSHTSEFLLSLVFFSFAFFFFFQDSDLDHSIGTALVRTAVLKPIPAGSSPERVGFVEGENAFFSFFSFFQIIVLHASLKS